MAMVAALEVVALALGSKDFLVTGWTDATSLDNLRYRSFLLLAGTRLTGQL